MSSSFRPGMAAPKRALPKLAQAQPISTFNAQPQSQPTYSQPQPQPQRSYSPQPQPQQYSPQPQPQQYSPQPTQVRYSPQPPITHQTKTFQPTSQQTYQPQPVASYSPRSQTQTQSQPIPIQYNSGGATPTTLKMWAAQQRFLDIYQVNAFYTGTAQRSQYLMSLWKT
eukprot:988210_1